MIEYQEIIDSIDNYDKMENECDDLSKEVWLLERHHDLLKIAVAIEQRNKLTEIIFQLGQWRFDSGEKLDSYIAERIESDKVVTSLLKDISVFCRSFEEEERENKMSERDQSGGGVTTEQAGSKEPATTQAVALLVGKVKGIEDRCFKAENEIVKLQGKMESHLAVAKNKTRRRN